MEIHRPKPWHGWRELAKEVGVIVIGIAIALAGEQAVEVLHRRAEVAEARHALRSEIAADAAAALANIEKERCLAARLDRDAAWAIGDAGVHPRAPGRPAMQVSIPGRPFFPMGTSNWQVVKTGAAAQMPLVERLVYSRFYDDAEQENLNIRDEIPMLLRLSSDSANTPLTPADSRAILQDVAALRKLATVRLGTNAALVDAAKAIGVEPAAMTAAQRENLTTTCGPLGLTPNLR